MQAPGKAYHWYKCLAAFATIAEISTDTRFQPNSSAADVLMQVLWAQAFTEMLNNHLSATWQNDYFFGHGHFPFLNNRVNSRLEKLLQRVAVLFTVTE